MPFQLVLNYRRGDAAGNAGRLHEALAARFGADNVFMDIDTVEPGVDFVEAIERAVGSCDVFVAMIGQLWLTSTNSAGQRRLDDPDDFVRLEIEAALHRGIRVIPVLVQDAQMPTADQLPQSLARFARRNAFEIRDTTWRYDVDRLIETLTRIEHEQTVDPEVQVGADPPRPPDPEPDRTRLLAGAAVAALLIVAALVAAVLLRDGDESQTPIVQGTVAADELVFAASDGIYDGSNERLPWSSSSDRQPDWSPDGERLALARGGSILVLDVSGRVDKQLTSSAKDNAPDWSPDGTRIAFDRPEPGNESTHDVWIVNADGTEEVNLTDGADESGGAPDWSPDGIRIVYQRRGALWSMRADGIRQEPLRLGLKGSVHEPDWSPRSSEIVFALFTDSDTSDIYRYDIDNPSKAPINLTASAVTRPTFPAWSSDGTRIVFAAEDGIYEMNRDGGGLKRLVKRSKVESPSLQPPRS